MSITISKNINKLFLLMIAIFPVIDSINGYLVRTFDFSIGTIYKAICIFILFLYWFIHSTSKTLIVKLICIIGYIICSVGLNILFNGPEQLLADMVVKLSFNIVFFCLIKEFINKNFIDKSLLKKVMTIQSTLIILVLLIPYILGIGYTSYSGGLGYKGFFYSHNELNATLLILFYFCLGNINLKKEKYYIVLSILLGICLFLMSSKSSMIGCIAGVCIYAISQIKNLKKDYINKKVIGLIALGTIIIICIIAPFIESFIVRQKVLFSNFSGDILSTLTSGRNLFVINAWDTLINSGSFVIKLIVGNGFVSNILIEMDFIDLFFYLGSIGVIGGAYFIYKMLLYTKRNCKKNYLRLFGLVVIIAFSFFTGHILFTATASTYFIIFSIYNMYC